MKIKPADDEQSYKELLSCKEAAIRDGDSEKEDLCDALIRLYDIESKYVDDIMSGAFEGDEEPPQVDRSFIYDDMNYISPTGRAAADMTMQMEAPDHFEELLQLVHEGVYHNLRARAAERAILPTPMQVLWSLVFAPYIMLALKQKKSRMEMQDAELRFIQLFDGSLRPKLDCDCISCSIINKLHNSPLFQEIRPDLLEVAIEVSADGMNRRLRL